jgi:3-oxoacyl-[acyl-carrier-protein] synthase III
MRKYHMKLRSIARKYAPKVAAAGTIMLASAYSEMEAKKGDIDVLGWAAVGLTIAVAVFGYVKRAAR